jgi:hypothetical protein
MKNLSISRILTAAIPVMVVCVVLALSASAVAQSSHTLANGPEGSKRCSNRTLNGAYGLTLEGTILGPNIPLRGVVMQNFDGNGNITQVDYLVVDGMPVSQDWRPGTGTYAVNPDCTGVAVLHTGQDPLPVNLHFVVVNNGKQINQVVDSNAFIAVGIKVN